MYLAYESATANMKYQPCIDQQMQNHMCKSDQVQKMVIYGASDPYIAHDNQYHFPKTQSYGTIRIGNAKFL